MGLFMFLDMLEKFNVNAGESTTALTSRCMPTLTLGACDLANDAFTFLNGASGYVSTGVHMYTGY